MHCDVLILGAGAAGLMCAIEAGKRGLKVAVLERADRVGKKILISGGGRCNFTNLGVEARNFLSANPHFCKSALARYTPAQFLDLVRAHDIPFYEKKLGQLFCRRSAKDVVAMLLAECAVQQVKIHLSCRVISVAKNGAFQVETDRGPWQAESLVVATGGLSYPALGATAFGYEVARSFGHAVRECRPALVPLVLGPEEAAGWAELSGLSAEVEVHSRGQRFREAMLFTHRGLSGPAILQISSYWEAGEAIEIDLFPDFPLEDFLLERKRAGERSEWKNLLAQFLPKRFLECWSEQVLPSRPLQDMSDRELRDLAKRLHHWELRPAGDEGYTKAEVTRGGVETAEISSQTLESRRVVGLYFVGEVMDVTGHLGGFNFQWAWASGFVAGQSVAS